MLFAVLALPFIALLLLVLQAGRRKPLQPDTDLVEGIKREAAPFGPRSMADECEAMRLEQEAELAAEYPESARPTNVCAKTPECRQVMRVCKCGASFYAKPAEIAVGKGKYCSVACYRSKSERERFEEKVARCPMSGCHIWLTGTTSQGYGSFSENGKPSLAHRVAWKLYRGPIQNDLCVLHRCDNPLCVNPAHLFLGTIADNNADRDAKGRHVKAAGPRNGSYTKPWTRRVGERNGRAKLTAAQVIAIKADRRPQRVIAADYQVGETAIGYIKRGRSWKCVADSRDASHQ